MQLIRRLLSRARVRLHQKQQPLPLQEAFRSSPVLKRLTAYRDRGWSLGIIYLDIVDFQQFEQRHGNKHAEAVLDQVGQILESSVPRPMAGLSVVALQNLWGDDYIAYVGRPSSMEPADLLSLAERVRQVVERKLNPPNAVRLRGHLSLRTGAALLEEGEDRSLSSQVYQAAKTAQALARGLIQPEDIALSAEFQQVITGGGLHSVYQPVVNLATGRIFGWEALMRGPAGSHFASPGALLQFAESHAQMWGLERAARRAALAGLGTLPPEARSPRAPRSMSTTASPGSSITIVNKGTSSQSMMLGPVMPGSTPLRNCGPIS